MSEPTHNDAARASGSTADEVSASARAPGAPAANPAFLRRDELVECTPWQSPVMGADGPRGLMLTARQMEDAYEEAFERGRQEGLAAGAAEVESRVHQLERLLGGFTQPFEELDEQVEHELVTLAITLARHVVRRELKLDRGQVVGVVRESIGALPSSARDVCVHLHPDDARLVRELTVQGDGERRWRILDDPLLTRGGARITSESSQIDARVETRLGAIVSAALGGDRERDGEPAAGSREPVP